MENQPALNIYYKPATIVTGFDLNSGSFIDDGAWFNLYPGHRNNSSQTRQILGNLNSAVSSGSVTYTGLEMKLGYDYASAYPKRELWLIKAAAGGTVS